ncbi:sugar transferase [Gammaproteobacteria bacterium]|nr:sugar transferase [Gammaproteobacteria bacterium]
MQRLFDICLSLIALVALLPLFIILSLILRTSGEGEVIYSQKRIGINRKIFNVYKFATMVKDSPNIGAGTLTMKRDPRVLPVGKILRKTKINELPQIFNILIGDMSIIGPRPLVEDGENNYTQEASLVIRSVPPGITGIGSLILRDEESYYAHRSDAHDFYVNVISPFKQSLELWYVQNRSFLLNTKIFFLTILSVIFPSFKINIFFKDLPKMPRQMRDSKV